MSFWLRQAGRLILLLLAAPGAKAQTVVISQIYGGGGNTGATLRNDFIELFNRGPAAVNVSGWSVQYASATGDRLQVTPLSGASPAGSAQTTGRSWWKATTAAGWTPASLSRPLA